MTADYHLAQLNLGWLNAPLDDPSMAEFVEALDRINAEAEASPGFVWRLVSDDGQSSSFVDIPGIDDPLIAPNFSVWTDFDALKQFMYKTDHVGFLRRRSEWFRKPPSAGTVLWWCPADEIPDLAEAVRRLEHLRANGPSAHAWTLAKPFPKPAS